MTLHNPAHLTITRTTLAAKIDHTALQPETTEEAIRKLCFEADQHSFYAVCVNPCRVALAASLLKGTKVRTCSVVGFPFGASSPRLKAAEAMQAVKDGAIEIDMVINIGWLLDRSDAAVSDDIRGVRRAIGKDVILKVILETSVLRNDAKRRAAQLAINAGADFLKTSTGFHPAGGATLSDVALLRDEAGRNACVKASGGIRDTKTALEMIEAGADRLGTSASVAIVEGVS